MPGASPVVVTKWPIAPFGVFEDRADFVFDFDRVRLADERDGGDALGRSGR